MERAGGGCACPESVLLRALVTDLILFKNQALILDMEAGIEHLGRATARGVDTMLVVVEPGQRSVDCAERVRDMAGDLGIQNVAVVANKVSGPDDEAFLKKVLGDLPLLGSIPYSPLIRRADRDARSVLDEADETLLGIFGNILDQLEGASS